MRFAMVLSSLVCILATSSMGRAESSRMSVSQIAQPSSELNLNACRWVRVCGPRGCSVVWRCF